MENELVKMNNELDHMKTMRKCLAYDVVSLGLAVKGVELTEKSILPTKGVQTEDKQYQTDQQQVRELEEARAVETILDDQKYNKAMELIPPKLKDMNFSPKINLQIYEKMKENPTKTIILSLMDDNQVTLQATDKEFYLLPNEEVAAQLQSLEDPHTQQTTDPFTPPEHNYAATNIVQDIPPLPQQLNLPYMITSADQIHQVEFQQIKPTDTGEFPKPPLTQDTSKIEQVKFQPIEPKNTDEFPKMPLTQQMSTRTLEGEILCEGCNKTFTRKHDLEKHKLRVCRKGKAFQVQCM